MSSRAEQLRAQARAVQERGRGSSPGPTDLTPKVTPAPPTRPESVPAGATGPAGRARRAPAVRTKPVRRTVDLSPTDHAGLTSWCSQTAVDIGAARVTGQDVLRTLVSRLLRDPDLAEAVRSDLASDVEL